MVALDKMVYMGDSYYRDGGLYGYGYAFGYGRGFGSYHEGFVGGCFDPCYYGGGACNPLGSYYYPNSVPGIVSPTYPGFYVGRY